MIATVVVEERVGLAPEGLRSLRVAGPLTLATAPDLRRRLREEARADHTPLVLDLQAVTGLDASGVAALLDASRYIDARRGGRLKVRANPVVIRALKESGTLTAFNICNG
jgi:anti-anti-sigma factor